MVYKQMNLKMPKVKALLLLALVIGVCFGSLTITEVVLEDPATTTNLYGSIMGGTKLYIKGLGFSPIMSQNTMFVGPYPCKMEDGATDTTILCITTAPPVYKEYWNLPITVIVENVGQAVAPKGFSYVYAQTPYVYGVYPSVSYGGQGTQLNFYGVHRIQDLGSDKSLGSIYGMYIGDKSLCSRFGLFQAAIAQGSNGYIQCYQPTLQQAGKYAVSEHLFPGRSASYDLTYKATLNNSQSYQFVVLPLVNSTTQSGSKYGQIIDIKGTGFSPDPAKISVKVDGVKCDISESTLTQIKCLLQEKKTESSILPTNSTNPSNQYNGGSGFFYQRYDLSGISNINPKNIKKMIDEGTLGTSKVVEEFIAGEIKTGGIYGSNYAAVWKGYFVPTVDGEYTFRGVADDMFAVYLNTETFGSKDAITSDPITYADTYNPFDYYPNYYYNDYASAQSKKIALEAGKQYYMQVYHVNGGGAGSFSLSVEVPNVDTTIKRWQTYEVHTIKTNTTVDPQIIDYNSKGATSGNLSLRVYETDKASGDVLIDQTVTFPWNASDTQFCNQIKKFTWFYSYETTCTVTMKDANGADTLVSAEAVEFTWRVSINKYREDSLKAHVFQPTYSAGEGTFTVTAIQNHSPLMSGTFTATVGGVPIQLYDSTTSKYSNPDIPYNIEAYKFEQALRQINGFELVEVERAGDAGVASRLNIYYIGFNQNLENIVVSGAGLKGGKDGTSPTIEAVTRRQYSSNLFVDPVDYRFMRTYSDKPNVQVTVNGIPSACNTDCTYTFIESVPTLTALSLNGNTVTIGLTNPTSLTDDMTKVTVTIDGKTCSQPTGTIASFTCTLPQNADSTPILTAGKHYPVIVIDPIGYAKIDKSIPSIDAAFALTSTSKDSGSTNGGYDVTIIGTGFPQNTNAISFTLCGKQLTIKELTNTNAVLTIPSCATEGAATIKATFGSQTPELAFTYSAPDTTVQITSISPSSWSPVLKSAMTIEGSGFGTDVSKLQVWMTNSSGNVYQMKVLSVTDTQIKAGIPGGLPGTFDINVIKEGFGNALPATITANDFVYEVSIASITPTEGSIGGGTLITIVGKNFVPDTTETMVTIGDQLNQLCRIESITATEIKCRTPEKHEVYLPGVKQEVTVTSKLVINTKCAKDDPCWFTFKDDATSPVLESLSSEAMSGSYPLTLTGSNFNLGTSVTVSLLNLVTSELTEVTPTEYNTTSITITVPKVESGYYSVRARTDPSGESNALSLTLNPRKDNISQSSISVMGGQVAINGWGFPKTWPSTYYNKLSLTTGGIVIPLDVVSSSTTQLVLRVPKGVNAKQYSFKLTSPTGTSFTLGFSQQDTATPTVDLTSTATISPNTASTISLTRTVKPTTTPQTIVLYSITDPSFTYTVTGQTYSSAVINFPVTLNSGKYGFRLYDNDYGYFSTTTRSVLSVSQSGTYTVSLTTVSYNGGLVTVTGNHIGQGAVVKVNGVVGKLAERTDTEAKFHVPKLITQVTQDEFMFAKNETISLKGKTTWGDAPGWESAFDNEYTTIYNSSNLACSVGVDIGESIGLQLTRVRYFPNPSWPIASEMIKGALIEVSNDNSTWKTLGTVDQSVHAGWNSKMITDTTIYRYVRFSHTNQSQCNIAELELTGILMNTVTVSDIASFKSDLVFDDGVTTQTFTNAIEYREDKTPIVTGVTPDSGDVFGNYDITITGVYFGTSVPTVTIDGKDCVVSTHTDTQIECKVAQRLELPSEVTFVVSVDGTSAIIKKQFRYVLKWSDPRTWGTDLPPIAGDLVYVPQGMHLLVDESTPVLAGIVVQNATIQFADTVDMTIEAGFITLRGGQFIAGTEEKPYQHQLTFIMHGSYYGKQQPMFGNKGIGCLECKFTMHGQKRSRTWTMIKNTINPGENQFETIDDIDWKVGESVVVASTSYDHNEAEQRTIKSVSGRVVTVTRAFKYQHYAGVEDYGSDKLEMRAEVGLLTRNIKMMGDQNSVKTDYGSHLMLAGSAENGLVGKIAYVQFTKCGQPQIVGRYCHHFHMAGDVPGSYSIGNSVHHSMARILTIHGVHYLYVAWNVGYRVKGHNFFIEDGIETNNIIEYNLAISSLLVNNMMQTDMSVASFWVTNPSNILRYNHAAGSDFYGIWYEIKQHPDGPSATEDICPIGNPLGESHDNVAHSNVRFGLRIFQMYARQHPCQPIRDNTLQDPWSANPSIQSKFYNYELWKNGQAGLLAQQTGNMLFENFTIAQSKLSGMQFYKNNFTRQHTKAKNFIIIGRSTANPPASDSELSEAHGVILPRTGEIDFEDIRFYSFTPEMTVWKTCSKCDNLLLYTNFGATYFSEKIKYTDINGKYFKMLGLKKEVFYDLDGTMTNGVFDNKTRTSATVSYGWEHLLQDPACLSAKDPTLWDKATACDQTVTVRQVMFTNLQNTDEFKSASMKARMLATFDQVTSQTEKVFTSSFSLQKNMEPSKEMKFTYSLPFLTGRIYNIWWGTGLNFNHMAMVTSNFYTSTDKAILFKFNYTQNRELFEIGPLRQGRAFNNSLIKTAISQPLDAASCGNGDYYHNNADDKRVLELCASGKNRSLFEYMDINSIYCRYLCPAPPGSCTKEKTLRYWNNATQWPNQIMPADGDNVTIPCEWTMMMDMSPARIAYFQINGDIIIPDTQDITIVAQNIWIKGGSLKAGTSTAPFTYKLVIQVNGKKDDLGFTVNPELTGNKMIVNTGRLELFGNPPGTIWTRLTAFADKGATSITVGNVTGWKVGDELGLAPSFSGQKEFEKVTITAITGNVVSITPALQYSHYGDPTATIIKSYGTMDMRTGVGHLTRNIQITSGDDAGWGFHLIQFGYVRTLEDKTNVTQTGNMTLTGVEFIRGGQYDTERAALEIVNVRKYTEKTLITKSSFHECQDFCFRADNVYNVEVENNVFFHARKFHVRALDIFAFTFKNNLMAGVTKRETLTQNDLIACFASYNVVDPATDAVNVTNNLCQGSQGHGFVVPDVNCVNIDIYPFAGNTAGSCDIGWIFARGTGDCLAAKGVYAYASNIGQMHNPPDTVTIKFKNFILADNMRSMTIRIGGSSSQKTAYLNDSYFAGIARPNCTKCYGQAATQCIGGHGIRMLTTGTNGQKLPGKFGSGFDVVCKQESIDGKTFIYNTEFSYFRQTYTGNVSQCSNNVIFKPHDGGSDFVGSSHLWNATCANCELTAYGKFTDPPANQIGWFGGCGDIVCTGFNNYIIADKTGTFLPTKGILLANNYVIGDNTPGCTKIPQIKGHYCTDEDFGVLEYESIAPDFNTRIMWPVSLTFDGGNWTSITNGWREWQWNGGEPLNKRLGRFVSVVKLHKMYNMSFLAMPPEDMTFKLQKRQPEGNTSDWVIVKLYYPKPNSIRVEVGGQAIKPIQVKDGVDSFLDTSVCGSNKFFYTNYTVHFVVTGDPSCKVRVTLTNSIQLTAKFDMNIDDFYKNDGVTTFISRMCALLSINDTSRVKVVGVYSGSVNIVSLIEPQVAAEGSSSSADSSATTAALTALNQQISSIISSGSLSTQMAAGGLGAVLSAGSVLTSPVSTTNDTTSNTTDGGSTSNNTNTTTDTTNNTTPTPNNNNTTTTPDGTLSSSSDNKTGMIVGIVVGVTALICIVIVGVVCYMRQPVKLNRGVEFDKKDDVEFDSDVIHPEHGQGKQLSAVQLNNRGDFE